MTESTAKKRTIPVEGMRNADDAGRLEAGLRARLGVLSAAVDLEKGKVLVEYDLRHVRLEDLEKLIVDAGYRPGGGLASRMGRGILRFTEATELDNLRAAPSPCCSDPVRRKRS